MKVRLGSVYTFRPNAIDTFYTQHHSASDGQRVRVIQLPGAPKPNTMNHAHIESLSGDFLGLVSTGSLIKE